MKKPHKILALMLILLGAVLTSQYLASLRAASVEGKAANRNELKKIEHANLLSWLLPKQASQIKYWIIPKHRHYEFSFRIKQDDFEYWIDHVQGGEVEIEQVASDDTRIIASRFQLVEIPEPDGIDFHMQSLDYGMVHIAQGLWLPNSTTSKFHQFSAAFDAEHQRAYVSLYR